MINPQFHMDEEALAAESARMAREPRGLERPVVILGGWHSPGVANWSVESILRPHTSGRAGDFLSITYPFKMSVGGAADAAVRAMRERGMWDRELDIVGVSMGGVIARALAAGTFGHGDPRVRRIFTIAAPHRGAKVARVALLDRCAWELRPKSRLIAGINQRNGS